jgi:hypothetical protein
MVDDDTPEIVSRIKDYYSGIEENVNNSAVLTLSYDEAQLFMDELSDTINSALSPKSFLQLYHKYLKIDSRFLLENIENPFKSYRDRLLSFDAIGSNGRLGGKNAINNNVFILDYYSEKQQLNTSGGSIDIPALSTYYYLGQTIYMRDAVITIPRIEIRYLPKQ